MRGEWVSLGRPAIKPAPTCGEKVRNYREGKAPKVCTHGKNRACEPGECTSVYKEKERKFSSMTERRGKNWVDP